MAGYNKVILMGNLTRDPVLKTLPSQTVVCDFSLAVNRRWKNAEGQTREDVLFIDCCAFGKQAETFTAYLRKGRPVHIEGRLKLDRWEQEDGQRRSKVRVIVEQFRFVGSSKAPSGSDQPDSNGNGPSDPPKRPGRGRRRAAATVSAGAEPNGEFKNDDIPY